MEEDQPYILAQFASAPGSRLHFSWGLGNEIYCCDVSGDSFRTSTSSCVQWGVLASPQRRIAYDSAAKFVQLQQRLRQTSSSTLAQSQEAWAAVEEFSTAISSILETSSDAADLTPEDIQSSQEKSLWDLASLFALDPRAAESNSIPDLARWLKSNAAALAGSPSTAPLPHKLAAVFEETSIPESHPQFWPTVQRLVALGWVADALEILGLHSAWLQWGSTGESPEIDAQIAVLEATTLLLRRMPCVRGRGASGGATSREFDTLQESLTYRKAWQQQCKALLEDTEVWNNCESVAPETSSNVETLVRILAGDSAAVAAPVKSWAELLVARLLHMHADLQNLAELRQLLHDCLEEKAPPSEFHHVLAAFMDACCEGDIQTAMRSCSEIASDWLMAHIPTILTMHPAGMSMLGRELPHLGTSQVEFYQLEYAAALAAHTSTWPLAASYLAWCEVYGQKGFETLIGRLPLNAANNDLAFKAAEISSDQGLAALAGEVYRRQGAACWQQGLVGAALTWLTKVSDIERIDAVLANLAKEVWSNDPSSALQTVNLLKESIDRIPSGSANHAMVQVKTMFAPGKRDYADAVELLRQLPQGQREKCLHAMYALPTFPMADPSKVTADAVMQMLQWLETYGKGFAQQPVARLALVRLLVATHASAGGQ